MIKYVKDSVVIDTPEEADTHISDPDGVFEVGDEYSIEKYLFHYQSFEDFKKGKASEIDSGADQFVNSLSKPYPEFEKLTFDIQAAEAQAYLADNTANAGRIKIIAQIRGISVLDLAQRIMFKDQQFSLMAFSAAGLRQKYHDQLALIPDGDKQAVIDMEIDYSQLLTTMENLTLN